MTRYLVAMLAASTLSIFQRRRCRASTIVAAALLAAAARFCAAEPGQDVRPQGTIAFSSVGVRHWDLYSHAVGEREPTLLTRTSALDFNAAFSPDGRKLAFVSDRDGNLELYIMNSDGSGLRRATKNFAMDDHPTWSPDGRRIAFVSTREPSTKGGQAWNAIYVMNADGTSVRRLSRPGAAAYSPAWSPDGSHIAFASGSGRAGRSDIWVMNTDGEDQRIVIANGGWPTFVDEGKAIAFHRRGEKNRWGIWRVNIDGSQLRQLASDASMPRAASDGRKLAVVVHGGRHKQVGILDVDTAKLDMVTTDRTDHWNPAITADGTRVVYHKVAPRAAVRNVELWGRPPDTGLNLLRVAGAFPAFSPDGRRLALTGGSFGRIDVMNVDGSNRKTIFKGTRRSLFGMSWSVAPERIAFSHGVVFGKPGARVNIIAASPDSDHSDILTSESGNNGFPCYSPDGKQIVFRSGRDGSKNLYIMDRSGANVRRLTKGKWVDTMCHWSPTGKWIAFSSDRGNDFEIWLIRPDGTGLRKLIGGGGRNTHPHFSPDGKWIVFASQRAGYSAEEVSLPSQPQPYGDLFVVRIDGTGLLRLTHNGTEEGTPAWASLTAVIPGSANSTSKNEY